VWRRFGLWLCWRGYHSIGERFYVGNWLWPTHYVCRRCGEKIECDDGPF
jgi:hypothetical protein